MGRKQSLVAESPVGQAVKRTLSQVSGDIGKILSKVKTKLDVFVLESSPWWLD